MYTVCPEHLEKAIDEFVDVYDSPPDLYMVGEVTFTDWAAPATCDFCDRAPKYLVV